MDAKTYSISGIVLGSLVFLLGLIFIIAQIEGYARSGYLVGVLGIIIFSISYQYYKSVKRK